VTTAPARLAVADATYSVRGAPRFRYSVNQFVVDSDVQLPCDADGGARASFAHGDVAREVVRVRRARRPLHALPRVWPAGWLGSGDGRIVGAAARAYDIGDATVVCAALTFRMVVGDSGRRIVLDYRADDPVDTALARIHPVGLGLSMCTLLTGGLPLHAAGVVVEGRYVALMADSGVGKSTLLWALMDRGARFGGDDVVVTTTAGAQVVAHPSQTLHAKLAESALAHRGIDCTTLSEVYPGEGVYLCVVAADRRARPQRLSAILTLEPTRDVRPDGVAVERVVGSRVVAGLLRHTHGLWPLRNKVDLQQLLLRCQAVAATTPVFALRYQKRFDALPRLADAVHAIARRLPGTSPGD
jgi:hypothetical protein